jgi:hypothetical protein
MSLPARRPSPAMVVACVALVLALAGTSIAAIGDNSVGAEELGKVKQRSEETIIPADDNAQTNAKCKSNEQLLGGGATLPGANPDEEPSVEQSGPVTDRKWLAVGNNTDSAIEATLRVTVLCLKK